MIMRFDPPAGQVAIQTSGGWSFKDLLRWKQ
jgi:hypothetical protein